MEINLMIPKPPSLDLFNINTSNCSSPYISAPSSPQRPLNFYSAPASPRRFSSNSGVDFDRFSLLSGRVDGDDPPSPSAVVPFDWEFKPGVPKSSSNVVNDEEQEDDFEFEFSGQLDMMVRPSLSSADELFDGGKIRPLKPPPMKVSTVDSPRSPKSTMSKFRDALSPKQRKKNPNDPFEAALNNTTKIESEIPIKNNEQNRGRSKNLSNHRVNSRKGMSRSLSPLRVSEFALHQQEFSQNSDQNSSSNGGSSSSRWGSRKWRLRDFLLFRSASEGRATTTGKDPLRNKKYFSISSTKRVEDEGSFRSTDGSVSKRRGQVSAHERHYMKNRAVSEEQKKKTSLPYKPGLLACLGFNPALHDITKAFGSFPHS